MPCWSQPWMCCSYRAYRCNCFTRTPFLRRMMVLSKLKTCALFWSAHGLLAIHPTAAPVAVSELKGLIASWLPCTVEKLLHCPHPPTDTLCNRRMIDHPCPKISGETFLGSFLLACQGPWCCVAVPPLHKFSTGLECRRHLASSEGNRGAGLGSLPLFIWQYVVASLGWPTKGEVPVGILRWEKC